MYAKRLHFALIKYLRPCCLLIVLSSVLVLALVLSGVSSAEHDTYGKSTRKTAANETRGEQAPEGTPTDSQEKDAAALEALRARKAALDTERSQIERELAAVIERGLTQRVTRAIWRVNEDLEAVTKRLTAHYEEREAFERNRDAHHASLADSPELKSLKERKAILDQERAQIQEMLSELAGKHRRQINQRREIRWYKVDLRAIKERLVAYQENRDALENDLEVLYSSK